MKVAAVAGPRRIRLEEAFTGSERRAPEVLKAVVAL